MAKIKVLIEGYAIPKGSGYLASSTVVLVEDMGKKVIIDPGINRPLLLKKLKANNLKTGDIDIVIMTHYHPDHNFLCGIFENAVAYDDSIYYKDDYQIEHKEKVKGTSLKVVPTPGHDYFHGSVVVPTEKGTIVVAGDVFWWDSKEKQDTSRKALLEHEDPFTKDKKALLESRKKLIGHGKMFPAKGGSASGGDN